MPQVSVMILTKNRAHFLEKALRSVEKQSFRDFEVVVVNDGSTDGTEEVIQAFKRLNIQAITHAQSRGIIASREEALDKCNSELVAILDDDDIWVDEKKLEKQVKWFRGHAQGAVCGGGIRKILDSRFEISDSAVFRPQTDTKIRNAMLLKNPFFTSTVMFRKQVALEVGGFEKDQFDFAEDYDLWLRMGKLGELYNFQEVFTAYRQPSYNKEKFRQFLEKQGKLAILHKKDYPNYQIAIIIIRVRMLLNF